MANNTTYTNSGTYTFISTNAAGCTNTATLNLTINQSTTSNLNATACNTYTWLANNTTYTNSGTYTFVSTNAAGCTNTATLNLTIEFAATPTGNATQTFNVFNINDSTIANLVVNPTTVIWYANLNDALAQSNPLVTNTVLLNGANYFAVNKSTLGCFSTPFEVNVSVNLGNESFDEIGFDFYPNPTSSKIFIKYSKLLSGVSLTNLLGQELMNIQPNDFSAELDLSHLPTATYFVKVVSEGKIKVLKVLKN